MTTQQESNTNAAQSNPLIREPKCTIVPYEVYNYFFAMLFIMGYYTILECC